MAKDTWTHCTAGNGAGCSRKFCGCLQGAVLSLDPGLARWRHFEEECCVLIAVASREISEMKYFFVKVLSGREQNSDLWPFIFNFVTEDCWERDQMA